MDQTEILKRMCDELTKAELKAIGRSRGFSHRETGAPDLLGHVFLSDRGVKDALATLDPQEAGILHLLNAIGQAVDVRFFTRIDHTGRSHLGYSFNERYAALYRDVRARLVRKGVLLCATKSGKPFAAKETVLERRRFLFPPEFAPFLPPPCSVTRVTPGSAPIERRNVLREKLEEVIETVPGHARKRSGDERRLVAVDGKLLMGSHPFSVQTLRDWQTGRFVSNAPRGKARDGKAIELKEISLPRLTLYALSRLRPDEWAAPDALVPLWELACPKTQLPDPDAVCRAGLDCGCLESTGVSKGTLFRIASPEENTVTPAPEDYLTVASNDAVAIDLRRVPLDTLELLTRSSTMSVDQGRLTASPALLKFSHLPEKALDDPVLCWLRAHHPAFGRAADTIAERQGKTIIHENLLIACVKDLGLKVRIEKAFADAHQVVPLSKEFIAFAGDLLPGIEKLMKKTGHVIKRVSADDAIRP